jgi:hypothetical protein
MSENPQELFAQVGSPQDLGSGAYFWIYLSPQHETEKVITDWTVTLTQGDKIWSIHSTDPEPTLKTLGGSGVFEVRVEWRNPETKVVQLLKPLPESKPEIGCNENCAGMIGLLAPGEGEEAGYWTVWDAFCN